MISVKGEGGASEGVYGGRRVGIEGGGRFALIFGMLYLQS